jgi:cytochrome c553
MLKRSILVGLLSLSCMYGSLVQAQTSKAVATPQEVASKLKEVVSNPQRLAAALKSGAKTATFCGNCHGDGGNSVKPDVPNLAGQNESYLLDQLKFYVDGQRPTNDFKRRLIKVLSLDEKVGLVAFYARQEVITKPVQDASVALRGKTLYKNHCADCHEMDGHGNEEYSRVAGQQTVYMSDALRVYRDNPATRFSKDMVLNARKLSDAHIAALVAYIASMK